MASLHPFSPTGEHLLNVIYLSTHSAPAGEQAGGTFISEDFSSSQGGHQELEWQLRGQNHPETSTKQEQRQSPLSPGVHTGQDIHCAAISNDNFAVQKLADTLHLPHSDL